METVKMKTTFPFDVGTYLFYEYKNNSEDLSIIHTLKPPNRFTFDSEALMVHDGFLFNTNQAKFDRILQLQDLEICVPYLKKYSKLSQAFLKDALIWCLLQNESSK